jgi:hypothetical protein
VREGRDLFQLLTEGNLTLGPELLSTAALSGLIFVGLSVNNAWILLVEILR